MTIIEYRSASDVSAEDGTISGLAAPFNSATVIGDLRSGGFRETIAPGAFSKTIQERDIVLLVDHDTSRPVARKSAGTLEIRQSDRGLEFSATPAKTSYANDLVENIRCGNVAGTSFGFVATKEDWADAEGNPSDSMTGVQRTIREAKLFEITAATFPAYEGTELSARDAVSAAREARAKYSASDKQSMLDKGQALKNANGEASYPVADKEDLSNAISAVGRGGADHDAIRRYIMARAKALGLTSMIPDGWNADGSISGQSSASPGGELRDSEAGDGGQVDDAHALAGIDAALDAAFKEIDGTDRNGLSAEVNQFIDLCASAWKNIGALLKDQGIPDPDKPNGNKYDDSQKPADATSGRSIVEHMISLEDRRYG